MTLRLTLRHKPVGILFTTLLLAAGGGTGHRTNQATRGLGGESAFRGTGPEKALLARIERGGSAAGVADALDEKAGEQVAQAVELLDPELARPVALDLDEKASHELLARSPLVVRRTRRARASRGSASSAT